MQIQSREAIRVLKLGGRPSPYCCQWGLSGSSQLWGHPRPLAGRKRRQYSQRVAQRVTGSVPASLLGWVTMMFQTSQARPLPAWGRLATGARYVTHSTNSMPRRHAWRGRGCIQISIDGWCGLLAVPAPKVHGGSRTWRP